MNKSEVLEKLVLAEVEGKKAAIQSYDGIIWKIRTGYLTLLFAGWAILLKSIADAAEKPGSQYVVLIVAMFLFSAGLALGGYFVDRTYTKRKARVISAQNALNDQIIECARHLEKLEPKLLHVSGDDPDRPIDPKGFHEAMVGAYCVYFIPLMTLAIVVIVFLLGESK
jgi:hypothetical protein